MVGILGHQKVEASLKSLKIFNLDLPMVVTYSDMVDGN